MLFFRLTIITVALLLNGLTAHAEETSPLPVFTIMSEESSVAFTAMVNKAPSKGEFSELNGTIIFDPAQLERSSIAATIHLSSVTAVYDEVASTLVTAPWLDVATHATARFHSEDIRAAEEPDHFTADGTLTLKGITQPVTLAFHLHTYDPEGVAHATGTARLMRQEFKVGEGEWASDSTVEHGVDVTVTIHAQAE